MLASDLPPFDHSDSHSACDWLALRSVRLEQDTEVQAAVLSFINTLVMSEKMLGQRIAIRNALEEMNFSKVLWAV